MKLLLRILVGSLLCCLISLEQVKETVPASNAKILSMINALPNVVGNDDCLKSEDCAKNWIEQYNVILEKMMERGSFLEYQLETDLNDSNENLTVEFAPISVGFDRFANPIFRAFLKNSGNWSEAVKRTLFLGSQGILLSDQDTITVTQALNKLKSIYGEAKVCRPENPSECAQLEPELTEILASSRNYSELLWAWKGWHEQSGGKMRSLFTQSVDLQNKGARDNGYKDLSEYWIQDFETDDFEKLMDDLYLEIKPFYQELHAYVRRILDKHYKSNYDNSTHDPKLIQAHLLGNMWGQTWENIFPLVKPFPNAVPIDYTQILKDKGFTPMKIFQESEKFFVSLGLYNMTPTFWKKSMIVKPENRSVVCHASAHDFSNGFDYRIKMCTVVNKDSFYTVHHEMGHIEYFMAYQNQTPKFRTGANSAFHEAIGDTIALSVLTPTHLKAIGLIDSDRTSYEQDINNLMEMALTKFVFLPFGYLMDKWRWNVFRGVINESNYNTKWWELRKELQGLEPPVPRSELDFDPGAKFHIATFVPYARYYIANFNQFQFYKALCRLSNFQGPFHKCDFYNSEAAGAKLKEMLMLGASRHWTYSLKVLTNETTTNAKAVFQYFSPLIQWLKKENRKAGVTPGW